MKKNLDQEYRDIINCDDFKENIRLNTRHQDSKGDGWSIIHVLLNQKDCSANNRHLRGGLHSKKSKEVRQDSKVKIIMRVVQKSSN